MASHLSAIPDLESVPAMKRIFTVIGAALVLGLSLSVSPIASDPAAAAGCIKLTRIYYDSPGADYGSNASLNAEWVRVKNVCSTRKSLQGWTIKDIAGHRYAFGAFSLGAGKSVKV